MSRSFYLNNIQMYIRNLESKRSLFIEMKLNTDNGFCVSGKKKKKKTQYAGHFKVKISL